MNSCFALIANASKTNYYMTLGPHKWMRADCTESSFFERIQLVTEINHISVLLNFQTFAFARRQSTLSPIQKHKILFLCCRFTLLARCMFLFVKISKCEEMEVLVIGTLDLTENIGCLRIEGNAQASLVTHLLGIRYRKDYSTGKQFLHLPSH